MSDNTYYLCDNQFNEDTCNVYYFKKGMINYSSYTQLANNGKSVNVNYSVNFKIIEEKYEEIVNLVIDNNLFDKVEDKELGLVIDKIINSAIRNDFSQVLCHNKLQDVILKKGMIIQSIVDRLNPRINAECGINIEYIDLDIAEDYLNILQNSHDAEREVDLSFEDMCLTCGRQFKVGEYICPNCSTFRDDNSNRKKDVDHKFNKIIGNVEEEIESISINEHFDFLNQNINSIFDKLNDISNQVEIGGIDSDKKFEKIGRMYEDLSQKLIKEDKKIDMSDLTVGFEERLKFDEYGRDAGNFLRRRCERQLCDFYDLQRDARTKQYVVGRYDAVFKNILRKSNIYCSAGNIAMEANHFANIMFLLNQCSHSNNISDNILKKFDFNGSKYTNERKFHTYKINSPQEIKTFIRSAAFFLTKYKLLWGV